MKIERINENQIRCTISKSDLAERKIKLSELACGTGNSKELFRDMIRQASDDFGFEVDDIPLMVEAIPISPECIILILTKVENPEETESHFAKLIGEEESDFLERLDSLCPDDYDESITDEEQDSVSLDDDISSTSREDLLFKVFIFKDLNTLIDLSKMIYPLYEGDSALYKSQEDCNYYLSLCTSSINKDSLRYASNILTEYSVSQKAVFNTEFFYMEHFDTIIDANAIEKLASV